MCGIAAILGTEEDLSAVRKRLVEVAKRIRHRGPDWSGMWTGSGCALAHERLAIVDPDGGAQPIMDQSGQVVCTVNGEIYNHAELKAALKADEAGIQSKSDCEAILHVWMEHGEAVCNMLDGIFAFVLVDTRTSPPTWIAARDPIGVIPMYFGYRADGSIMFASEMKCMIDECPTFELFPPGHVMTSGDTAPRRWFEPKWITDAALEAPAFPSTPLCLDTLREKFEAAVVKRMMCDVPYGVLLSGGLDSSLVASIVSRHAKKRIEEGEQNDAWWPRLHTFSIGLKGSPDLANARVVADFLGTVHHEYNFTLEEGLDAVAEVIQMVETYDITSIRASTPMFLMARKIKALGVKMVLSGEGADEIFGGYLYFHKAPNREEFHTETCSKMKKLHLYDCNRANKSTSAWGVEARVPFLDKEFVRYSMDIEPTEKMCVKRELAPGQEGSMEKWILRKAFDTKENPYLPDSVLWRQKEQFSDGVGYSWIDTLKEVAESSVSDAQMASAAKRFATNTPLTKEGYRYREIFEEKFKGHKSAVEAVPFEVSVACSTGKAIEWDESFKKIVGGDDSGRSIMGVHLDAYADQDAPPAKKSKTQ